MPDWLIPIILSALAVVGLIMLVALLARNYIKVPPNKVAVFYGRKHGDKGYVVITGGSKWKWPIVEDVQFMDMAVFQLKVGLKGIPNKDGVKVNLDAVATCKIKSDQTSLGAAVERFLGKTPQEIHATVLENLEGQLRSVVGTMSVETLIKDREALNNSVKNEATGELDKIGVGIDILNIQSITDDAGYIDALGQARTAEVMKDAEIGRANAQRDAQQQATTAVKDGAIKAAENDALTAEAEQQRDVKKAQYQACVAAEQARANQAGPLSDAQARQSVVLEEVKVEEEREKALIGVQAQKALVAEQRETAEKVVPAKKAAEAQVARAEGEKRSQVIASEGSRESAVNAAEAEKRKRELEGEGEAAKIRAVGLAEAEAIRAKLEGEAAGLLKKAEAYKAMDQAASLQLILEKLPGILEKVPAIVEAAAKPMTAIDKVVVIDQGSGGSSGIQRFMSQVPATLLSLMETAGQMGLNVEPLFKKFGVDSTGLLKAPDVPPAPPKPAPAAKPPTQEPKQASTPTETESAKDKETE